MSWQPCKFTFNWTVVSIVGFRCIYIFVLSFSPKRCQVTHISFKCLSVSVSGKGYRKDLWKINLLMVCQFLKVITRYLLCNIVRTCIKRIIQANIISGKLLSNALNLLFTYNFKITYISTIHESFAPRCKKKTWLYNKTNFSMKGMMETIIILVKYLLTFYKVLRFSEGMNYQCLCFDRLS